MGCTSSTMCLLAHSPSPIGKPASSGRYSDPPPTAHAYISDVQSDSTSPSGELHSRGSLYLSTAEPDVLVQT